MQRYQNWPKHLATYNEVLGSETSLFIVHKYTSSDFSRDFQKCLLLQIRVCIYLVCNPSSRALQSTSSSSALSQIPRYPDPNSQHCLCMILDRQIIVIPCQTLQGWRNLLTHDSTGASCYSPENQDMFCISIDPGYRLYFPVNKVVLTGRNHRAK